MRSWGLRGTPEGPRREVRPKSAGQTHMADESVGKPDSVRSLPTVAIIHLRPLLPAAWCDLPGGSGEQPSNASADARTHPFDLAPSGVYRSTPVTWDAGGLLHRLFTLTSVLKVPGTSSVGQRRSVFCGTVPRVTPGGCYPPPCSVESGLSSTSHSRRRDRLTDSSTSKPSEQR